MSRVGAADHTSMLRTPGQFSLPGWWAVPTIFFLLLPGHPLSYLGGLPWGPLALTCAVLLGLGLFAAWPLPASRWLSRVGLAALALAAVKIIFALAAPRHG